MKTANEKVRQAFKVMMNAAVDRKDKRRINALHKAAAMLSAGVRLRYAGGILYVPSATNAGVLYRLWKENGVWKCDCAASLRGEPCWHTAAAAIIERAGYLPAPSYQIYAA
jgi:hypothetical protein